MCSALYVLYLAVLLYFIWRTKFFELANVPKVYTLLLFLLKVAFGIGITLIYTYYYTDRKSADIYKYFDDANVIYDSFFDNPTVFFRIFFGVGLQNAEVQKVIELTDYWKDSVHGSFDTSSHLITRMNILFRFVSFGSIYIHTLLLCFLSFSGLTALFQVYKKYFGGKEWVLILPLFLLPSVLFWGSGLLKESMVFTLLGWLIYLSDKMLANKKIDGSISIVIILGILLISLKSYILFIALLAFAFDSLIWLKTANTKAFRLVFAAVLIAAISILGGGRTHIAHKIAFKRNEFTTEALRAHANSILDSTIAIGSPNEMVSYLPSAIKNTFLKPSLWDKGSPFEKAFALENLLLIVLAAFCIYNYRPIPKEYLPAFAFCVAFCILLYLLIGMTVTVMGAIVRYKVIGTPFLVVALLFLLDLNKIKFVSKSNEELIK